MENSIKTNVAILVIQIIILAWMWLDDTPGILYRGGMAFFAILCTGCALSNLYDINEKRIKHFIKHVLRKKSESKNVQNNHC